MNIVEALQWADSNSDLEVVQRLRSRAAAKALADEVRRLRGQEHRAEVLAATIRELRDVITHDAETKAEFIARVREVLSADPDARVPPNVEFSGTAKRSFDWSAGTKG